MLHIATGEDRSTAHHHDTVLEARECEDQAAYEKYEAGWAKAEADAFVRMFETNEQHAYDTQREAALEDWLLGV